MTLDDNREEVKIIICSKIKQLYLYSHYNAMRIQIQIFNFTTNYCVKLIKMLKIEKNFLYF